jgi:predicted glutamine amidotransferase
MHSRSGPAQTASWSMAGGWRTTTAATSASTGSRNRPATANGMRQQIMLLASVPLTDESWRPWAEGEVIVVRDGCVLESTMAALPKLEVA